MLQQKEISRLLSQAVDGEVSHGRIHAASLLSANGLPLITVAPSGPAFSQDNLRMYSLLAVSLHKQQRQTGDGLVDAWDLLVLEPDLKVLLKTFATSAGDVMFVSLFYSADYPDTAAKARLDSVGDHLAAGLAGYTVSK